MAKLLELGRRILAWCSSHKLLFALVVTACVVILPNAALAAEELDLWTEFTTNPIDATALLLAAIIQNITALLGMVTLRLIEMIVIPILGYNGFYNSNITNLGWSLVRDVVNMFVVVVLLVIAVMTIVGYSAANWTQQLPRLFIAIVLVNFSKLICGVFIDLSQVVMFTFVNAIVSIAAGNFAAMLGLSTFGQFGADFLNRVNEEGTGLEAFMYLGAAYLQFVIYLAILGVMFLLAVAFIWRIVVLWILIIMSPLAFFMIGIKDIFHTADGVFNNWKGKFVSALTFGPTLTFFLWLALAASSGSTLAQTEDFPLPEDSNDLNLPLEMFSLDNFLGMFLALAILIAGMQQASSMAKGMEGFASSVISDKMGMGLAKGLARPFKSSKALGKAAISGGKVGNTQIPGLANIAPGYTQKFGKMAAGLGQKVSTAVGPGIISSTVGGALAGAGAYAVHAGKDERKARNKAGAESAEHMTDAQKTAYNLARADANAVLANGEPDLERRKRGLGVLAQYGENELHGARMKDLLTKEKAQKGLRKDLEDKYKADGLSGAALNNAVKNDFDNVMKQHIAMSQTDEGKAFLQLSSEEKDSIEDTMTANPHLIEPKTGQTKEDAIKAHFQAMEDKKRLNVGAISTGSFTGNGPDDIAARAALQSFKREGKDGKKVSLWSEMESGKGTIAQRKAIVGLISAADVKGDSGPASVASLVRAGAVGDKDADGTGTSRRQEVINRLQLPGGGGLAPSMRGSAAAALLDTKEYTPAQVFGDSFSTLENDIPIDSDIAVGARAMVTADTASARHLSSVIQEGGAPSAATLAASSVSKDDVKRLRGVAATQAGTEEGIKAEQALDVISRAVEIEKNNAGASEDHKKRMKGLSDELVGRRYGRGTPGSGGGGAGAAAAAAAAAGVAAGTTGATAAGTAAPAVPVVPRTRRGGGGGGGSSTPPPAAGPTPGPGPGPGPAPAGPAPAAPAAPAPASTPTSGPPKPPKPTKKPAPPAAPSPAAPAPAAPAPAPAANPTATPAPKAAGRTRRISGLATRTEEPAAAPAATPAVDPQRYGAPADPGATPASPTDSNKPPEGGGDVDEMLTREWHDMKYGETERQAREWQDMKNKRNE